jgi:translation initiation factor IF-3
VWDRPSRKRHCLRKGRTISKYLRVNHQIRVTPIRLIDQDDNQVGVVETDQARRMALEAELDLVEVAPTAKPPVCRIMDYGKWKYEQKKKDQRAKSHRHEVVLKEIRMRPRTDPHDAMIKVTHARGFLAKGNKVQFTMLFRGREMVHVDLGRQAFEKIKQELAMVAKIERDFKMEGRRLTLVVAPLGAGEKPTPLTAKAAPRPQVRAHQPAAQAAPPPAQAAPPPAPAVQPPAEAVQQPAQ